MVKDAEQHAEEDAARKEEAEVRNNCRFALVNATQTDAGRAGRQGSGRRQDPGRGGHRRNSRARLRAPIIDAIKAATEKIQQAGYKLAEVVYATEGAAAGAQAAETAESGSGR